MADDPLGSAMQGLKAPNLDSNEGRLSADKARLETNAKRLEALEARTEGKIEGIDTENQRRQDEITTKIGDMKWPTYTPTPAPIAKETSPVKQWGSLAMLAASFGGLMTRRPLMTAMNAASSAIMAMRQGDQEQYDRSFAAWKESNANALKMYSFQVDQTKATMTELERLSKSFDTESERRKRDLFSQLAAESRAMGNEDKAILADMHDLQSLRMYHLSETRTLQSWEENAPKVVAASEVMSGLVHYQKTHQNATPEQRLQEYLRLTKMAGYDRGQGDDIDMKAAEQAYRTEFHPDISNPTGPRGRMVPEVKDAKGAVTKPAHWEPVEFKDWYEEEWPSWDKGGSNPSPEPQPQSPPPPPPPPPHPGGEYKTADDVVKAFKAKKITREKAAEILKANGWAQ